MISSLVSSSPTLGSVLTAQSLEPALGSVSPSLSPSSPACARALSLSLSLAFKRCRTYTYTHTHTHTHTHTPISSDPDRASKQGNRMVGPSFPLTPEGGFPWQSTVSHRWKEKTGWLPKNGSRILAGRRGPPRRPNAETEQS